VSSYVELLPRPELAGVVRTLWVQRTGESPYAQRDLPTGGVEVVFPLGGRPVLTGPLTSARVHLIPAGTTLVGVRFLPGAVRVPVALEELVDQRIRLDEVWGGGVDRLAEAIAGLPAEVAVDAVQDHLFARYRAGGVDAVVAEAVRRLMPWRPVEVGALADELAISVSQFRRRCLRTVGITPKALQRTLRFQGLLALAQAGGHELPGMATDVGYADHAHLCRECVRLTGLTPTELLGARQCACGHDHAASYRPFLAGFLPAAPVR
jgi:AraC-like DNA-binding protein